MLVKLSTITSVERNLVISQVRTAISSHEGWIVDHTFLSNMVATIIFEMPGTEFFGFATDLLNQDIRVKFESPIPDQNEEEIRGIMSLTFIHDDPDLKRDVPHFG